MGENGHGSLEILLVGRGYEARIETDIEVLPPSVRIPGSVAAAPVCLNGGSRRWGRYRNPRRRWGALQRSPTGAPPNGELSAEDSSATGGLGIHEDHPRAPGPELHGTAGITNGCDPGSSCAGYPAAGYIGLTPWGISQTRRAVGALQRSQGERPPRRTLSRGFRRY